VGEDLARREVLPAVEAQRGGDLERLGHLHRVLDERAGDRPVTY